MNNSLMYTRIHTSWIQKSYLHFSRMHIDIQKIRLQLYKQRYKRHHTWSHLPIVCIHNSLFDNLILDWPIVYKHIKKITTRKRQCSITHISHNLQLFILYHHLSQMRHPIRRIQRTQSCKQPLPWLEIIDSFSISSKSPWLIRMYQGIMCHHIYDILPLRLIWLKKFFSHWNLSKEILDKHTCPMQISKRNLLRFVSPLQRKQLISSLVFCPLGLQRKLRHLRNTCKRLSSKSICRHTLQISFIFKFGCRISLHRQQQIIWMNSCAVIINRHQLFSGFFYDNFNFSRTRIQCIFDKFFDHWGRTFYYFSCFESIDHVLWQLRNIHLPKYLLKYSLPTFSLPVHGLISG